MSQLQIVILISLAAIVPIQAPQATEYSKEVVPVGVETHAANRPASPSSQGRDFVHLSAGPWSIHSSGGAGIQCNEEAALLPENNATALAAVAAGKRVFVVVDNTLTSIGGICQVTLLDIRAD